MFRFDEIAKEIFTTAEIQFADCSLGKSRCAENSWLFNARRRRWLCWRSARRVLRGLTFEVTGRQRQDAKPGLVKMYRVPPARAWWPAVGAPVDRGVRRRWMRLEHAAFERPQTWGVFCAYARPTRIFRLRLGGR